VKAKDRRGFEIAESTLKEILPEYTLDTLKKELYDGYLAIQQAYSNYQYDQLDQLCSFDLARQYKLQLNHLHEKHATNIMNGFEFLDMKIQDVRKEANNIVVKVYLKTRYIDYTVDDQNTLLRGDYQNKVETESMLVFYRKKYTGRPIRFCPKCGGEVKDRICSQCGLEVIPKNRFLLRRKGAFL
ncbi:MAG: TIM44-like domain-containing protein, partial [Bacilli bacterium]|nr:TIM44-like domain-containing protein [Bacilli bacterium]